MIDDDDITPEKERAWTAAVFGNKTAKGTVVETRKRRPPTPPVKEPPHLEIVPGNDGIEDHFEFVLVKDDQRVMIGMQWDRDEVLKMMDKIRKMGLKVEFIYG